MRLPVQRAVEVCPVEVAVSVLGGAWKLTVIKHLARGTHRFGELCRLVPLANRKTLTRQLRELEEDGVLVRTVHPEVPPRVEYALTELGRSLTPVVAAMDDWGGHFSQVNGLAGGSVPGDEAATAADSEMQATGSAQTVV